ncbi:hypothetical protein F4802DRAFT_53312 [Xylaria palmicola]|nr:hypothetical protein F4802DRAFT_53312 [Xylaria palmicola]
MESTHSPLTSPSGDLRAFTKFGQLPAELRVKIWQLAMPDGRLILVNPPTTRQDRVPASLEEVFTQSRDAKESWESTAPIPALLHVNTEARYEASMHYSLSLGVGTAEPRIYVDFTRDTIFFGDEALRPSCSDLWVQAQDIEKIQRLAVAPEGAWRVLRRNRISLNSLEKIIFVHGSEGVRPGHRPQLVEDQQTETGLSISLEHHIQQLEAAMVGSHLEPETPKQRMEAAKEEFATLKLVLLAPWDTDPVVSTAVFKGDA